MLRTLISRITLTLLNILLPPLAVLAMCDLGFDFALNCLLFLCAVIPAHIHGFYIAFVYFHRRHKVKKDRYPGGPKPLIRSENVINGGASAREVERLRVKEGLRKGKRV